ncbi:MAG: hypothetical protein U0166_06285 [Acidobacteriota bacterium]
MKRAAFALAFLGIAADAAATTTIYPHPASSTAGSALVGDVEVTFHPSQFQTATYSAYPFTIVNRATDRKHRVTITVPSLKSAPGTAVATRTITVAPGSRVSVSLYDPGLRPYTLGSGADVDVDGVTGTLEGPVVASFGYGGGRNDVLLVSNRIGIPAGAAWQNTVLVNGVPDSEEWLAYSGVLGMVLARDDADRLSAPAREALASWVRLGGILLLVGDRAAPEGWPAMQAFEHESYVVRVMGFGRVITADEHGWEEAASETWRTSGTLSQPMSDLEFPVVEGSGIPVITLFVMMIGYVLVIGPANLIVLGKMKKLVWLVVTIPAISFATSGTILLWAILAEGVTPVVRLDGFTILDQRMQRATTIGRVGYYAPLAPSQGLRLPYEAEVLQMTGLDRRAGTAVDWSTCQHHRGGVVPARTPVHFSWRSDAERRERLEIHPTMAGGIEVVNGLSVAIEDLYVASDDGHIFRGRARIGSGSRATLEPAPELGATIGSYKALRTRLLAPWYGFREADPFELLVPGSYVAFVERNPFIDPGIGRPRYRKPSGTVFGIFGQAPRAR